MFSFGQVVGCKAGIRYRFGGRNTADFAMYLRVRAIEKLVVEWGSAVAISDLHQKKHAFFPTGPRGAKRAFKG